MRYSYGIMDKRKILLYNPQLFLRGDDILIFPSKDFIKWHGNIREYIDGLYQINSKNMEKTKTINMYEHNLAMGVLHNISEEMKELFNLKKQSDSSYRYISTLNDKYKKLSNIYSSDMQRCDIRIPVITPTLKYQHLIEIIRHAERKAVIESQKYKTVKKL